MRTRTTSLDSTPVSYGALTVRDYLRSTGALVDTHALSAGSPTLKLQEGFETIVDYPEIKGFIDKPVDHQRQFCDRIYDPPQIREDALLTPYFYEIEGPHPHWYAWGNYGRVNIDEVHVTYPKSIDQLSRDALHRLHSMNEVDNLTNIVESPSFITGIRDLGTLVDRAFGRGDRTRRTSGASRTGALIAHGWLYWAFGVAPLLSDMKKINKAMSELNRNVAKYQSQIGKLVKVRAKCRGNLVVTPTSTGYGLANDTNTWWHLRPIGFKKPPMRIVTVTGIRDRQKFSNGALQKLQYFADRYGSAGPASFAWERVPYSFVVDWFVDLSRIIDAADQVLLGRQDKVISICASESWSISADVERHHVYSWDTDSEGYMTVHNELKHYHREPINSPLWVSLDSNFGKRQSLHTAALLHNIVAKLRSYKALNRIG